MITASRLRFGRLAVLAIALLFTGCLNADSETNYPDPELYDRDVTFEGEWSGEIASMPGRLEISVLRRDADENLYYGMYRCSTHPVLYVLRLEQVELEDEGGAARLSNLARFHWQDGRGDRGDGWLLINRDGTALTGTYGRGDQHVLGLGQWVFTRAS